MKITNIKLNNFRCFPAKSLQFKENIIQILGPNGIGKTSLLEALYYTCYLKSFRTHIPKELINFDNNFFSITTDIEGNYGHDTILCGLENLKKFAKINQKNISSFKEIHTIIKVLPITQNDISIIEDGPAARRSFMDHTIIFFDSEYIELLAKYNKVLKNKNSVFWLEKKDLESYILWTSELIKISRIIHEKRKNIISIIQGQLSKLGSYLGKIPEIELIYEPSSIPFTLEDLATESFVEKHSEIINKEYFYKRALFGTHLDDLVIYFNKHNARTYSSRGQQKLTIFLLKFAIIKFASNLSLNFILLIDDFFSDFDEQRSEELLKLATQISTQMFITSPSMNSTLQKVSNSIQSILL